MNQNIQDYVLLKFLLIGESGSGKTSLMIRYTEENFLNNGPLGSIGIDFKIKSQELNGTTYKLQIWDTAGQERFRTITSAYYKNAKGIIITCDLSREDSLTTLNFWLDQVKANANETPIIIVGTKNDLPTISIDIIRQFANDKQIPFISTSAKENNNVKEAFIRLIKEVIIRAPEELPFYKKPDQNAQVNKLNNEDKWMKKCC